MDDVGDHNGVAEVGQLLQGIVPGIEIGVMQVPGGLELLGASRCCGDTVFVPLPSSCKIWSSGGRGVRREVYVGAGIDLGSIQEC